MVLTITSRKGGCGKTVLSMILAAILAEEGADVALLDTDPNLAAYRWATETRDPPLQSYAQADAERLAELLPTLAERHELLIIDTAGFGNQAATVAAAGADFVLVPVTPGEAIWSRRSGQSPMSKAWAAARAGRSRSGCWRTAFAAPPPLSRHVLSELEKLGLPCLQTVMSEAVGYGEISFSGALPRDGSSAAEIAALLTELRAPVACPLAGKAASWKSEKA